MNGLWLPLVLGFGVGIYGYLLPGTINLGVFQVAMNHHRKAVRRVLWVVTLVEIPYCFLCMSGMGWILRHEIILEVIRWLIVGLLILMAVLAWRDARLRHRLPEEAPAPAGKTHIRRLLLYAIFNPFQLSAWAIWGTFLLEKNWFSLTPLSLGMFSLGAAAGVYLILYLYAVMGRTLIRYFASHRKRIDYGIVLLLLVLAVVQLVRNMSLEG